jgi:GNAT superfamily N-acetyltransferase
MTTARQHFTLETLDAQAARVAVPALADVLQACVADGASVSFMQPLAREEAQAFWSGVAADVAKGDAILIVARSAGEIVGTTQARPAAQPNQPHRFDLAKMLVAPHARGRGVGAALLARAEAEALKRGRWLGVLDTVTDSAGFRLYTRGGWIKAGEVPDYALWPHGGLCPTTFFYKRLERPQ